MLETTDSRLLDVATHARGPAGALPLTPEMLVTQPSGNLFGLTQNAGMGWDPQMAYAGSLTCARAIASWSVMTGTEVAAGD